ncbi:MAG: 16S rRNA (guanine(966)-N(2))-methyltransferase RsmD [Clostridia bacterium]|nr:16S rRNA (guanine(966)-N(2))-methyltransferase RsmD [Clostridia bacterium]
MRVITGEARGMRLQTPEGLDVRPTAERVKEAIFSSIQFELEGRRFLDLFAGSGQMGIEALSRGAAHAVFVDDSKISLAAVRANLAKTKLGERATVVASSAQAYLKRADGFFDIAFLDPPYHQSIIEEVMGDLEPLINAGGAVICETADDETLPEEFGDLVAEKKYHYSRTSVTVYRKGSDPNG